MNVSNSVDLNALAFQSKNPPKWTPAEFLYRLKELEMTEEDAAFHWIAEKSFTDALPEDWEEEYDQDGNRFYYNTREDRSDWTRPGLDEYRQLFKNRKAEIINDFPPPPPGEFGMNLSQETASSSYIDSADLEFDGHASSENGASSQMHSSLLNKCIACIHKNANVIVQHLSRRGRAVEALQGNGLSLVEEVDGAVEQLDRLVGIHVDADEKVAANVVYLRKENDHFELQLEEAQDHNNELEKKIEELREKWEDKISRRNDRIQSLREEAKELSSRNEELSAKCRRFEQMLDLGHKQSADAENLLIKAEQEKCQLLEKSMADITEELKQCRQDRREAEKASDDLKLSMQAEELKLKNALSIAENELNRQREIAEEHVSKLSTSEEKLKAANAELEVLRAHVKELEKGGEQKSSDFVSLCERLKEEMQRERDSLKEELAIERDRYLKVATSESALKVENDSYSSRLARMDEEVKDLKQKVADSIEKGRKTSHELEASQNHAHECEIKISKLEVELKSERSRTEELMNAPPGSQGSMDVEVLENRIVSLRNDVSAATTKCNELQSEKARLEQEIVSLHQMLGESSTEKTKLEKQYQDAMEAKVGYESSVTKAQTELQNANRLNVSLQDRNNKLEEERRSILEKQVESARADAAALAAISSKYDEKCMRINELEESFDRIKAETETFRASCNRLEMEKHDVASSRQWISAKCIDAEQRLVTVTTEKEALQHQLDESRIGHQRSLDDIKQELHGKLSQLEAKLVAKTQEVTEISSNEKSLTTKLEREEEKVERLEAEVVELKAAVSSSQMALQLAQEKFQEAQTGAMHGLTEEVSKSRVLLEDKYTESMKLCDQFKIELKGKETALEIASDKIESMETTLSRLKMDLEEKSTKLIASEQLFCELQERYSIEKTVWLGNIESNASLSNQIGQATCKITQLEECKLQLENETAEWKSQSERLQEQLQDLQNRLSQSQVERGNEIKGLELKRVELEASLSSLHKELTAERQSFATLQQSSNSLSEELSKERTRCLELTVQLAEATAHQKAESDAVQRLSVTVAELKQEVELERKKSSSVGEWKTILDGVHASLTKLVTASQNEDQKRSYIEKQVSESEAKLDEALKGVTKKQMELEEVKAALELQLIDPDSGVRWEHKYKDLKVAFDEKKDELERKSQELLEVSKKETSLLCQLESKEATANTLQAEVCILKEEISTSQKQYQELNSELIALHNQLHEASSSRQELEESLLERLEKEKASLGAKCQELMELQSKHAVEVEKNSLQESQLADLHQRLATAEGALAEEREKSGEVWDKYHSSAAQVASLHTTSEAKDATIDTLSKAVDELRLSLRSAEERAASTDSKLHASLEESKQRVSEITNENSQLNMVCQSEKEKVARLEAELESARAKIKENGVLQRENMISLNDKEAKLSEALSELNHLRNASAESESTKDLMERKFTDLSICISNFRSLHEETHDATKMQADSRVLQVQLQSLEEKLSEEKERRHAAEMTCSAATTESATLKLEISRLESDLAANSNSHQANVKALNDQMQALEKRSHELDTELKLCQMEKRQLSDGAKNSAKDRSHIEQLEKKLIEYERVKSKLSTQLSDEQAVTSKLRGDIESMQSSTTSMTKQNEELKSLAKSLADRVKKLNEIIVELKGSIRVFCRVRPVEFSEECPKEEVDELVHYPDYNLIDFKKTTFEFDQVFDPMSSQKQVYEEVEPFVRSAMNGLRVCIFAYGQTSSGKTHTMEGPPENRGVNLRALETVMSLSASAIEDYTTAVSVSMLEVYNEKIRDLLDLAGDDLDVRLGKQGTHVHNLSEWPVQKMDDALELFARGQSNRQVASNNVNEHSSRSHLVILVKITRTSKRPGGDGLEGYLYLVDLAGSERVKLTAATGQRLKEAQNINKSLSSLGDVISALASGQKHVPYRNSKLTYLLQDALRENSKVLMFVNINPTPKFSNESSCSLTFASRCRSVAFGQASKKVLAGQEQKSGSGQSGGK